VAYYRATGRVTDTRAPFRKSWYGEPSSYQAQLTISYKWCRSPLLTLKYETLHSYGLHVHPRQSSHGCGIFSRRHVPPWLQQFHFNTECDCGAKFFKTNVKDILCNNTKWFSPSRVASTSTDISSTIYKLIVYRLCMWQHHTKYIYITTHCSSVLARYVHQTRKLHNRHDIMPKLRF